MSDPRPFRVPPGLRRRLPPAPQPEGLRAEGPRIRPGGWGAQIQWGGKGGTFGRFFFPGGGREGYDEYGFGAVWAV